jgi:Pyruvate/2-oxoglutarate dehydrogenase complex, dihydrolipoamide acyltransferase (E2) component, and related enzymes
MFGIFEFSAIINPPQCAILAVGGGQPYVGKLMIPSFAEKLFCPLAYLARALINLAFGF